MGKTANLSNIFVLRNKFDVKNCDLLNAVSRFFENYLLNYWG